MSSNIRFNRCALVAAMSVVLGSTSPIATADIYQFNIAGQFTMLDSAGNALDNTSLAKGTNRFQTSITGTLTYDTATGQGSMTVAPFQFFNGDPAFPATAQSITIDSVGSNNLLLANMTFDWNGNSGIPVSLAWDAEGLLDAIAANRFDGTPLTPNVSVLSGVGAVPASDGTYTGATFGYLGLGPSPLATTAWNTSLAAGCLPGDCMLVSPSGALPLITDTVANNVDFIANTGATAGTHDTDGDTFFTYFGIGGNPMADGPFTGFNANFDFTSLALTGFTDETAPVITLGGAGASVTLSVGDPWTDPVTCSDAIDGALTVGAGLTIGGDAVDPNTPGTYNVTYSCTDSSTNSANASRTVTVVAAGAPIITLIGDNPSTVEAAASYTDPGATCNDPEDGDLTATGLSDDSATAVTSDVVGSYTVTYTCTDSTPTSTVTTRTVNIVDTTAPTITLSAACPIVVLGGPGFVDPTPSATASDIVDGDLSGSVVVTGGPVTNPTFTAGELSRTFNLGYSVSDAAGNDAVEACQVIVGNPTPVVTLVGAANVTLNEGDGFTDPGATCQDFNITTPGTPDTLTATADISIDTTTPAGTYTITYSCTDVDMNTGTATRTVTVAGAGSYTAAATTSGSNFSMLDPNGQYVGGAPDIFSNWDGSLLTSTAQSTINMTMGSALPTPFFGFPWDAHDIRVFGPGSYSLTTSRGNPLSFTVGPNQIGAHMLFDWNNNNDIDVAVVWNINGTFDGNGPVSGQVFNLVSVDGDNDGFPGIRMPDGPFTGFSANFNINFTPAYTLPAVEAPLLTADQGGSTTRTVITGGGNVSVSASTGTSFDWGGSSAALVARAVGGTTSATFTFDPSTLTPGTYTVSLAINGGAANGSLLINVLASDGGLDVADDDNDGIPNYLDDDASGATPTSIQVSPGGVSVVSSAGTLELGDTAFVTGASGVGVTAADIASGGGIADTASSESCIGGCFDFTVTGLTPGDSVQVVLPLTAAIPADATYRKLIGGVWRDFSATGGNAIGSAASVGGVCPGVGGSFTAGLNAGHDCVRLTLVDGGPNDADGLPNGIVKDPGGVAVVAAVQTPVSTIGSPNTGGGCALVAGQQATQRLDLWLLAGLLGLLGLRRTLQKH